MSEITHMNSLEINWFKESIKVNNYYYTYDTSSKWLWKTDQESLSLVSSEIAFAIKRLQEEYNEIKVYNDHGWPVWCARDCPHKQEIIIDTFYLAIGLALAKSQRFYNNWSKEFCVNWTQDIILHSDDCIRIKQERILKPLINLYNSNGDGDTREARS